MTTEEFGAIALSFPGTIEVLHFNKKAFKINNRKIFATLQESSNTANIKLTVEDQSLLCTYHTTFVFPVPNKWGIQGWTTFVLHKLPKELVSDALNTAYKDVLKASLRRNK